LFALFLPRIISEWILVVQLSHNVRFKNSKERLKIQNYGNDPSHT
jgi:hypothetical protein